MDKVNAAVEAGPRLRRCRPWRRAGIWGSFATDPGQAVRQVFLPEPNDILVAHVKLAGALSSAGDSSELILPGRQ